MNRTLTIDYSNEVLLALGCSPEQFNEEAKLLVRRQALRVGTVGLGPRERLPS